VERVDLHGGEETMAWIGEPEAYIDPPALLRVTLSRLSGTLLVRYAGETQLSTSLIEADLYIAGGCLWSPCSSIRLTNNLVKGSALAVANDVWTEDRGSPYSATAFEHNTVVSDATISVDSTEWLMREFHDGSTSLSGSGRISNNIFSDSTRLTTVSAVFYEDGPYTSCADVDPRTAAFDFDSNLVPEQSSALGAGSAFSCMCDGASRDNGQSCIWDEDRAGSSESASWYWDLFSEDAAFGDPVFTWDPAMGSYALSPFSPAIDAGSGDLDPDGSPPDIGAFGGPEGDWYKEFPWPLD
jgi:hypothetical protein